MRNSQNREEARSGVGINGLREYSMLGRVLSVGLPESHEQVREGSGNGSAHVI